MAIKQSLKNRIEKLESKLLDAELEYEPELLIPEKTKDGWLIEGIEYDTEKEALAFAERLRTKGTEAWLEELAKDCWDDYEE